jgi:hypothetical protein
VAGLVEEQGIAAFGRMGGAQALAALEVVDGAHIDALASAVAAAGDDRRAPYYLWEVMALEAWARPRLGLGA